MSEILDDVGIEKGKYTVKVNHRKVLDGMFQVGIRAPPISSSFSPHDTYQLCSKRHVPTLYQTTPTSIVFMWLCWRQNQNPKSGYIYKNTKLEVGKYFCFQTLGSRMKKGKEKK